MSGTDEFALTLTAAIETWPLAEPFVISRGAKSHATVVVCEARRGAYAGRAESVPYARYGETPEATLAAITAAAVQLSRSTHTTAGARLALQAILPAGAARNAVDCALWALEADERATSVAALAAVTPPSRPILTAYTLSLDTPDAMAAKAERVANLPLLKLKLGGPADDLRMRAVRAARPDARLIADANEAWTQDLLGPFLTAADEYRVEMVEQPLPAGRDQALTGRVAKVAVCADESLHTRSDLAGLRDRYDAVNIKLDKTGGLTEALATAMEARRLGFDIMVGSMVSTSLAVGPALLLATGARWVDLDGPLLLARDRDGGLVIRDGLILAAASPPAQ